MESSRLAGHGPDPCALPPAPSLNRSHLRLETVEVAGFGRLESLRPAAAPYRCSNPSAPALLLVPGLGVDGLSFIRQLPLGAIAHLHFFQTPNQPVKGEQGLGSFARYVEEYILACHLGEGPGGLVLGGASMGSAISLLAALRQRVRVRGLVLLGALGSCRHLPLYQRLLAPLAYVIPYGFLRESVWRAKGRLGLYATTVEEAHWMANPLLRRTHGYFGRAVCALTRLELTEEAKGLRLPTLVVHAALDPVLPLAAGRELAQAIPGARLVTVEGARHSLFFTHASAVNAAAADFVAGLQPA